MKKDLEIARDVIPLGEFKARAADILDELEHSDRTLVLTRNGRSSAVVMSPRQFDRLRQRQRFLEMLARGLEDADAGRTMSTPELRERLRKTTSRAAERRRK